MHGLRVDVMCRIKIKKFIRELNPKNSQNGLS